MQEEDQTMVEGSKEWQFEERSYQTYYDQQKYQKEAKIQGREADYTFKGLQR